VTLVLSATNLNSQVFMGNQGKSSVKLVFLCQMKNKCPQVTTRSSAKAKIARDAPVNVI